MFAFLTLIKSNYRIIATVGLIIASAFFGYKYNDYKRDSEESAAREAAMIVIKEQMTRESEIARQVEEKLSDLQANERILERVRVEVVDRPIYNVQCIDEDGVSLIEKYARGINNE